MKSEKQYLLWFLFLGLAACGNKVNFGGVSEKGLSVPGIVTPSEPQEPGVETPVVVEPEPEVPVVIEEPDLKLKSGTCSVAGENVLSCLTCSSKDPVVPPPLLSAKAQNLVDIMTAACSIANKSDAAGYKAPSRQQIINRVIHCSPTAYPDTVKNSTQSAVINSLLTSPAAQQKAFGGLYYNSASRDFETYFGLSIEEARNTLCRRHAYFTGNLYPKEFYDNIGGDSDYRPPAIYVQAWGYRSQLKTCMQNSLDLAPPVQAPTVPAVHCSYETAEGEMGQKVLDQVNTWFGKGHTVYFEGFNRCGVVTDPREFLEYAGKPVKLAIKKCE